MSTGNLIQKKTIQNYLNEIFTNTEQEYFLQYEDFSANLSQMNQELMFDSNLTQQLFDRMCKTANSSKPTMKLFPEVFMEAIDSLDQKIDFNRQKKLNLKEKMVNLRKTTQSLKKLQRKGKLSMKKQVESKSSSFSASSSSPASMLKILFLILYLPTMKPFHFSLHNSSTRTQSLNSLMKKPTGYKFPLKTDTDSWAHSISSSTNSTTTSGRSARSSSIRGASPTMDSPIKSQFSTRDSSF